jgi:hypothetical protein
MSTHTFHRLPDTFWREDEPPDDAENPFMRALAAWDGYVARHGALARDCEPRLAVVTPITAAADEEPRPAVETPGPEVRAS